MKIYLYLTIFLSLLITPLTYGDNVNLAGEIRLPIYDGWYISTDTIDYPFQLINDHHNAELLVFKSIISGDGIISDEKELKIAVDQVVKDVILSLPEAVLLTNTGKREDNRVSFTFEFLSMDTVNFIELKHRLKGVMFRHPDNYQILYTLWAKSAEIDATENIPVLVAMQEDFEYYGPATADFFYNPDSLNWTWGAILIIIIIMVMYFFKKRNRSDDIDFADDTSFWRCDCGRLNHNQYKTCRRCGKSHNTEVTA